ncbi:unnamed protein product, partial [Iphiclides podalirius]
MVTVRASAPPSASALCGTSSARRASWPASGLGACREPQLGSPAPHRVTDLLHASCRSVTCLKKESWKAPERATWFVAEAERAPPRAPRPMAAPHSPKYAHDDAPSPFHQLLRKQLVHRFSRPQKT